MNPFAHYLLAKRALDDRSLHPRLWQTFLAYLDDLNNQRSRTLPLHLLELGCGIGTMFERIGAELQAEALIYTAVDSDPSNLETATARLLAWSETRGFICQSTPEHATDISVAPPTVDRPTLLHFTHSQGKTLTIRLICSDLQEDSNILFPPNEGIQGTRDNKHDGGVEEKNAGKIDAVIAHAFMDLVECRPLLTRLRPLLTSQAYLYLTINFDGLTVFEPVLDEKLDHQIEALYHATMDTRQVNGRAAGHSKTGRRLFHDLRATGYTVVDMASSDWTVFPRSNGYTKEDAAFLHHILDFVAGALNGHPALAPNELAEWIATRRGQIEAAELFYMAHQLDYLARLSTAPIGDSNSMTSPSPPHP